MMKAVEPPPVDAVIEAEALLRGLLSTVLNHCLSAYIIHHHHRHHHGLKSTYRYESSRLNKFNNSYKIL